MSTGAGAGFIVLLDAPASSEVAEACDRLAQAARDACSPVLGMEASVAWFALPDLVYRLAAQADHLSERAAALERLILEASDAGRPVFVLPLSFDFGIQHRQWLTEVVRGVQRARPDVHVHYDGMSASHPLLAQALVDQIVRVVNRLEVRGPAELGVLLVANGAGDADTRADTYRVMRLVWEQVGAARADVAFVRHTVLPLPEQLAACARSGLRWVVAPMFLFRSEQLAYAEVILRDCCGQFGLSAWPMSAPLSEHPNLAALVAQRMLELHRSKRQRLEGRVASARRRPERVAQVFPAGSEAHRVRETSEDGYPLEPWGTIASLSRAEDLRLVLRGCGMPGGRALVKPTWHGYASGTYTDPSALSTLLSALGEPAVLVEGHTAGRNRGGVAWDWEAEARAHRAWIKASEHTYLEATGLLDTMLEHRATYVNVTEAYWDSQCAAPGDVLAVLEDRGVRLQHEELAGFVPQVLFEQRGAPMVSFARFKGPTRLSISNLFGLLPPPLRSVWHGPNITYFARVCCDLAKLYGSLFELYGVVESLDVAVRWEPRGLYRSRWGNYDLVPRPGVVCVSRGLSGADVLAARLQGQDVTRSAFFDVVGELLGIDERVVTRELPPALRQRFG